MNVFIDTKMKETNCNTAGYQLLAAAISLQYNNLKIKFLPNQSKSGPDNHRTGSALTGNIVVCDIWVT